MLYLCSMFFVASEPRSPCFGWLSKVIWEFKIKTGLQSLFVEKLLTFPFPNSTVRYWQYSSLLKVFLVVHSCVWFDCLPYHEGILPTVRLWIECSILPLTPLLPFPGPEPYRSKHVMFLCSSDTLSAPRFICWITSSAVILPSLHTVINGLSASCVGPKT